VALSDSNPPPHQHLIVKLIADSDFFGTDAADGKTAAEIGPDGGSIAGDRGQAHDSHFVGSAPVQSLGDQAIRELLPPVSRPDVNSPDHRMMTNFHAGIADDAGESRQLAAGFSQNDAASGTVDGVFDPIYPVGVGVPEGLAVVRCERLGVLAQRFQPQRLEVGEVGFADQSDRNVVGQKVLLSVLLNGSKGMSLIGFLAPRNNLSRRLASAMLGLALPYIL